MIPVWIDYATPSSLDNTDAAATLGLAANQLRPVRFHGRVRQGAFLLRVALRALGELVWSHDTWVSGAWTLDPIVTVHPDRLMFEAFSQDQSSYGLLIVDPDLFEVEREVVCGTTNVDFTAWLWASLAEMRTSRETWFRVGPEGLAVRTRGAGGRFERRVDLPLPWVRGLLNLQGAMAMPGTRLRLRPVDLLAALRYLRYTKAKVSPRALRYELHPGEDARLVLEPWEYVVPLEGCDHGYSEPRTVRVWGRRRLRLIEGLLPFADAVEVYLKGRALPHFYAVRLPGLTFVLGLSGWSANAWDQGAGFSLLSDCGKAPPALVARAREALADAVHLDADALAARLGATTADAHRAAVRLCRQGRAMFDVQRREFRHRELFAEPPDELRLFPPDPREEEARALCREGRVAVTASTMRESLKTKRLKTPDGPLFRTVAYRDWHVGGTVGEYETEAVVNDVGQIIFGRCTCDFFREHLLNHGPCAHILALVSSADAGRPDLPSSVAASAAEAAAQPRRPPRPDDDDGGGEESRGGMDAGDFDDEEADDDRA